MPFLHRLSSMALVLGLLASRALALDPVTVVYDVHDLLIAIPEHPSGDATPKPVPPESLIAAVRGALPASAFASTLSLENGQLRVNAAVVCQNAVVTALQNMRAHNGRQVSLDTRLLIVTDKSLATLDADLRQRVYATLLPGSRHAITFDPADAQALFALAPAPDDGRLEKRVMLAPAPAPMGSVATAPHLVLFIGQRSQVQVKTTTHYVKSLRHIKGAAGAAAVEPEIDGLDSSVAMTVQAATPADGSSVALSLQCEIGQIVTIDSVAVDGGTIQVPHTRTLKFDGLYAVPANETLLIGNPECTTKLDSDKIDTTVHAFLLVTPTAIEAPQ